MERSYVIVPFNDTAPAPVEDLCALHAALLPRSPLVKLGTPFMRDFYYTVLPRERHIFGSIAYVDGKPAGFACATQDADGFMQTALKAHWPEVLCHIAVSIAASPRRMLSAVEAWRIMANRRPINKQREAELLSFGVLPEYRNRQFMTEAGLRISEDLIDRVIRDLRRCGAPLVRAIVDSDNTAARLFYHSHGWLLDKDFVPGWQTPSIGFVWRP
jgi:ribosomal protein S18 acetylase RimI-like enzyme